MPSERDPIDDLFTFLKPEEIIPREGWEITPTTGFGPDPWVKRNDQTEQFRLADRPLAVIDTAVSHKLTATLIRALKEHPERKIRFVDIGGGVRSRLVRDILRHPQFKGKVQATNIDPFAQQFTTGDLQADGINPEDLSISRDDFFETTLEPNSADIVFSWQFLDHLTGEHLVEALHRIATLLAPGGMAFLQEQWKTHAGADYFAGPILPNRFGSYGHNYLQKIADQHKCKIEFSYGETTLDGRTHIFGSAKNLLILLKEKDEQYANFIDFQKAFPEISDLVTWCRSIHEKILAREKAWQASQEKKEE